MRPPSPNPAVVPNLQAPLSEYADRLLMSTGLHAEDALRIASGQLPPPDELGGLAIALRAGWDLTEARS
jgi:hypothetical protein